MAYTQEQERAHIRELQAMLYGISFYNPAIPRVVPDGIYGKATADAVRAFQQFYGLRVTGEVNSATWEKIAQISQELVETRPEPLEVFPKKNTVISLGDRSFTVYVIQTILHALSETYGDLPDCGITGVFDPDTRRALELFQKMSGLPVTGAVDCKTWNMLASAADRTILVPY